MKADVHHHHNIDEHYVFSDSAKKSIFIILFLGIVFLVVGIVMQVLGGDAHGAADHALAFQNGHGEAGKAAVEEGHHGFSWTTRLGANLWINCVFFLGVAVIGVFFVAIQYAAHAGWSAGIKRIPEAFGYFIPVAAVAMYIVFAIFGHDLFHWTHEYLYDPKDPRYDEIIAGKQGFLNPAFYWIRMIGFTAIWFVFFLVIRKHSLAEDTEGGTQRFWKMKTVSTLFIIFFAISSSVSAWDWVMSIDTHWFSTMFGWYVFASWHVSGLAAIALAVIYLKQAGYLKFINENHLHDLGKFIFAFSIFWTYVWFSQFLLIYYANIPAETIYFIERLQSDQYAKFIFINLFLNFFFPFLGLMTRDAKRKALLLKIVCFGVLIGHWLDFYLMVTPGSLKENGGFGFMEVGLAMIFLGVFVFVVASRLAKAPLVARNHPMLQESLHHHI